MGIESLEKQVWDPKQPFLQQLLQYKNPHVLKNTVVINWKAMRWDFEKLEELIPKMSNVLSSTNSLISDRPTNELLKDEKLLISFSPTKKREMIQFSHLSPTKFGEESLFEEKLSLYDWQYILISFL